MDALSAALSSVRMTGAIFADAICTAPWGFAVPPIDALERVVHMLAPGTERVVGYHLVTEGEALVSLEGSADIPLTAGDIVIIPHGDAHAVTNGAPSQLIDTSAVLTKWLAGDVSSVELGGGRREDALRVRLLRMRAPCRPAVSRRASIHHQDQSPRRCDGPVA
jgi:hypothetical protein